MYKFKIMLIWDINLVKKGKAYFLSIHVGLNSFVRPTDRIFVQQADQCDSSVLNALIPVFV